MPDSHPEIDKDRAGKNFILTHFPAWDWYNTESVARMVADKAQEVIDKMVADLPDEEQLEKEHREENRAFLLKMEREVAEIFKRVEEFSGLRVNAVQRVEKNLLHGRVILTGIKFILEVK